MTRVSNEHTSAPQATAMRITHARPITASSRYESGRGRMAGLLPGLTVQFHSTRPHVPSSARFWSVLNLHAELGGHPLRRRLPLVGERAEGGPQPGDDLPGALSGCPQSNGGSGAYWMSSWIALA